MLFSRFASYFVGLASVGLLATASALPAAELVEKKRAADSVSSVISTLESKVNTILPQISALNPTSLTSTAAVAPLVAELTSALETASSSVNGGGLLGLKKRSADAQDVANQLATITTNIANTFEPFKISPHFIIFGGLLAEIDFALKTLFFEVNFVVDGVLVLVSGLLFDVVGLLQGLTFTLTLGLLGLL